MIVIARDALADALSTLALLVSPGDTIPILRHIVVEPLDGAILVEATNLDQSASVTLECECHDGDGLALEGRRLQQIIATLSKGGEVRINVDEGFAHIAAGRSRLRLPTLPVSDFPRITFEPGGPSLSMRSGDMARGLARVAYAHGNEAHRPMLCGACVASVDGKIVFVATNGKNLACISTEVVAGEWASTTWPTRFTEMLEKRLSGDGLATAELSKAKNLVRVSAGAWTLTSKLVELNFPDWRRVIPSEEGLTASVDCAALHSAVSRTLLATDLKGVKAVKLDMSPDQIGITHGDKSGREGVDGVPADCSGEDWAAFDSQYLLSTLANCGETATIEFRGVDNAATIRNPADPSFLALLYPYRL